MEYIILDAGGTAIQDSSGDIVIYQSEQDARQDMRSDDILISISHCPDNGGGTDDSVRCYCKAEGVDNNKEYGDFVLRDGDTLQDKLQAEFLPQID